LLQAAQEAVNISNQAVHWLVLLLVLLHGRHQCLWKALVQPLGIDHQHAQSTTLYGTCCA
jgi:hypothetical protein